MEDIVTSCFIIGMWITNIKNKMFQEKLIILLFVNKFPRNFYSCKVFENIYY